jgi:hypothetical protein
MVHRHIQKLFRRIPLLLEENPDIELFTIPVYARLLNESELATMLVDMIALYPEVPVGKICIELSADILYEDLTETTEKINELRQLGVKIAVFEVGDQFCPVFRLSEINFDYAFMDSYSTSSLDKDSCDKAYELAKLHFKGAYDEPCAFVCGSWLLYPENLRILSPTSNTHRFISDYDIIDSGINKDRDNLWRLFDTDEKNPDKLPANTSMRRAYVSHLKNGGKVGWGFGVMLR